MNKFMKTFFAIILSLAVTASFAKEKSVIVTAKIFIKKEMLKDFKKIGKKMVAATQKEEGCIQYKLYQDIDDRTMFIFVEEYVDADALKLHSASEYLKKFREEREHMLDPRKPIVEVYDAVKK